VYNELYAAWKREITEASLGALPPDFYVRIAGYLKHIKEENLADLKSVKINLLNREAQNVKRMLEELLWARYKKIVKTTTKSQKVPAELLTVEEAKMTETFASFTDTYQKFAKSLMQGQPAQLAQPTKVEAKPEVQVTHKRVTLRFSKSIPAIMGADMKSYGPFAAEDVASLPELNAKILVKQGLAVLVEVS
jgi:DNA replication factor GINS